MSALPAFANEKELQSAVIELARHTGWLYMHITDSRKSAAVGFPDLVLVHRQTGRLVVAELKALRGRVSAEQQVWLSALRRGGVQAELWRPDDWQEIQNTLTRERSAA